VTLRSSEVTDRARDQAKRAWSFINSANNRNNKNVDKETVAPLPSGVIHQSFCQLMCSFVYMNAQVGFILSNAQFNLLSFPILYFSFVSVMRFTFSFLFTMSDCQLIIKTLIYLIKMGHLQL